MSEEVTFELYPPVHWGQEVDGPMICGPCAALVPENVTSVHAGWHRRVDCWVRDLVR